MRRHLAFLRARPEHRPARASTLSGPRALLASVALLSAGCAASSVSVTETTATAVPRTVVLLHGYARGPGSMRRIAKALSAEGYRVCSVGYDSFPDAVSDLLPQFADDLQRCGGDGPRHFVTHSFGGILLRAHAHEVGAEDVGRAVMLAPPNHGSELSDVVAATPVLRPLLGPVVGSLGTGPASLPNRLGPPGFSVGIIAGDRARHPVGNFVLDGPSDGTVTVVSAKLAGMRDFAVVHRTHSFIMNDAAVIAEVSRFLGSGCFSGADPAVAYAQEGRCASARASLLP